ncbi:hypothetical protein [Peptoniphilus asaccharolyticus]
MNYKEAFLHYLPWYDKRNLTMIDLAEALNLSFNFLESEIGVISRNLFIDTALEALPIFQRDLGIKIDDDKDKRSAIQGYLHYLHQQTTEKVVQDLIKSYSTKNSIVELVKQEQIDTYKFIIKSEIGENRNTKDLVSVLKKVLPAHLAFSILLIWIVKQKIYYALNIQKAKKNTIMPAKPLDKEHDLNVIYGGAIGVRRIKRVAQMPEVWIENKDGMMLDVFTEDGGALKYDRD